MCICHERKKILYSERDGKKDVVLHCKRRDYCETSRKILEEKCSKRANNIIGIFTCPESVIVHSGSDWVGQSVIGQSTSGCEAEMDA